MATSVILGVFLIVCIVGAIIARQHAVALRDHGVRVDAVVTQVHDGKTSTVEVDFTTPDGVARHAEVGNYYWSPEPKIGDTPELWVDPRDPEGNVADVRTGPDFFSMWAFVVGGALCAGLLPPTMSGRIDWSSWS